MTSCNCGATWSGHRIEHCPSCHETFTGTSAGDRHRVGDHALSKGPKRRRCLSVEEMSERGMTKNARGQWGNGGEMPRFWDAQAAQERPEGADRTSGALKGSEARRSTLSDSEGAA